MNYATTYHIGYDKHTPSAKTKEIAPSVKRVYKLDATNERCKRNSKRQAAVCTGNHVANGFLRTSFLPRLTEAETVEDNKRAAKTERDFYRSLSRLAEHYHLEPMQTQPYGYPYNIALALWNIKEQLKNKVKDWEEIKLIKDGKKIFLTSKERYNTSSTLFYIPVIPLYRMVKNRKRKQAALLLLSVCSYLYHVAKVPYYIQEDSFLCWHYKMLKEWILSDEYTYETKNYLRELQQAYWIGNHMEQKIGNRTNLEMFKQRITAFKGIDTFDHDCRQLACDAFDLYEKYPNATVFRYAQVNVETEEDMENIEEMDNYISFCANSKGWLNENLEEIVNNELLEYGQIEEPTITICFDGSHDTHYSLDFENRLFSLMEELHYILDTF